MAKPLLIFLFISTVSGTIDLNIHHLQFVSDHLDKDECKELISSLHQVNYELDSKEVNISSEPDRPCIAALLKWDRTEGYGGTFNDLVLRLGQIGRRDVADKLSKAVYEEDAEDLDRLFLDDPFKKMIPKNSILEETKPKKKRPPPTEESDGLSGWEITGIVCGVVVVLFVSIFVVYSLFGKAIYDAFTEFAPPWMVTWVGMVAGECGFACRKAKGNFMKQIVGTDGVKVSRATLTEMNRNLNNYLHGDMPGAIVYFDELIRRGEQRNLNRIVSRP